MAVVFSIPQYVPDVSSGEALLGYEVQSGTLTPGTEFITNWTDCSLSPYATNLNIFDPNGLLVNWYRVKPLRALNYNGQAYGLDTPWSRPFQSTTPLYDTVFSRLLLPVLRFTYIGDQGIANTNSTVLEETTGAGQGVFLFDGQRTRFNLQYVMNDDPIKLLDEAYSLVYIAGGSGQLTTLVPYQDYVIDPRFGTITFATPPQPGDYARFDFRRADFVNQDLYEMLVTGVNALSQYGLNGYEVSTSYNLRYINKRFASPDLAEIVSKVSVLRLREGLTEAAMRSTTAWRDGSASVDPFPSRALQFLIDKTELNDKHIRREINTYIRGTVPPTGRGDFDIFWDLTQLTPFTSGMFGTGGLGYGLGGGLGAVASGLGIAFQPWWI